MIIVSQGTSSQNNAIREMIIGHDNIHFVEAPKHLTLGRMRNLSVELSHGEFVCQWDDDDWYHPDRIMTQFRHLRGGAVASLYSKYLKYFADTQQMYMIDHLRGPQDYLDLCELHKHKKFLAGSIMFKKSFFHEFNNCLYPDGGWQSDKEEDLNVLQKLSKVGMIVPITSGHEYCYVYHGGNVYQRRHHEMLFHKKWTGTAEELIACKEHIEKILSVAQIKDLVEVCSTPLLDFDQDGTVLEGKAEYVCRGSWK
jgi:glycosyltransferase involved in cell wall biosynthesis